jgi:hypothetical protein
MIPPMIVTRLSIIYDARMLLECHGQNACKKPSENKRMAILEKEILLIHSLHCRMDLSVFSKSAHPQTPILASVSVCF